jgi:nicotinate-nucleotide adenylyltransferase
MMGIPALPVVQSKPMPFNGRARHVAARCRGRTGKRWLTCMGAGNQAFCPKLDRKFLVFFRFLALARFAFRHKDLAPMPERIGVLGGTFSPVHIGHLRAAEEAIDALELDTFFFLPAAVPPHKTAPAIVPFEHRWRLLNLAIAGNQRFEASALERTLSGKSFTVRSLTELRKKFRKESEIYFLLGLDAFLEINTWWHYRELFTLARVVVMRRPRYQERDLEKMLGEMVSPQYVWDSRAECFVHPVLSPVYYLKITRIDISSTQIRDLVAHGKSIRYLVPPESIDYIMEHGLYAARQTAPEGAGHIGS